ncbi:Phycobilisome protein [Leptolyngbyaceae cyanobacterium JSC-12]|nr:Phycobilisome protein [Leptolyngbyaceae cyanobacterium JSC-12]
MHTLNYTLEQNLIEADGRYLDADELQPLERYIQTYTTRLETYHQLREHSDKLVLFSLRKFANTYPELIQQHGARCKFDMSEVLRYIAIAILRDDELFFKEQMMVWLDTILLAHKRNMHCSLAYRNLQEAIAASLPAASVNLIRPYLDLILQSLQSHA